MNWNLETHLFVVFRVLDALRATIGGIIDILVSSARSFVVHPNLAIFEPVTSHFAPSCPHPYSFSILQAIKIKLVASRPFFNLDVLDLGFKFDSSTYDPFKS